MTKHNIAVGFAVGIAVAIFSGCASTPNTADRMREHVSDTEAQAQAETELKDQLAADWEEGHRLIESGNRNIEDGLKRVETAERELSEAKAQIERGHRELAEGREMAHRSEIRFRDAFPDLDLTGDR